MKTKSLNLLILLNIVWILVIFILCAMPGSAIPDPHLNIPHLDKVVHFGMYFILSVLLAYLLESYTSLKRMSIYAIAILTAFIYGGLIEILQQNYFNRSGDIADLLADVLGGIAGCLCYPYLKRLFPVKK